MVAAQTETSSNSMHVFVRGAVVLQPLGFHLYTTSLRGTYCHIFLFILVLLQWPGLELGQY